MKNDGNLGDYILENSWWNLLYFEWSANRGIFWKTVQILSVQPNNKRREVPQWQSRPQPFFPLQWTCSFAAAPLHWTCHAADAQIPRLIERSCLGFQGLSTVSSKRCHVNPKKVVTCYSNRLPQSKLVRSHRMQFYVKQSQTWQPTTWKGQGERFPNMSAVDLKSETVKQPIKC